jgi:hypothetical protein
MDIKQLVKKCSRCGEVKSLDGFYKDKHHKDGLNSSCKKCIDEWLKVYYIKNRDRILIRSKKYSENNPEREKERKKQYYKNNKELINKRRKNNKKEAKIYQKNYYRKNKEYLKECMRVYQNYKRKTDLRFNLNSRMANAVGRSLRGNKKNQCWEDLVDYTVNDLITHLKKTIPKGYTWQDCLGGRLHIDHKIPKSVFNFTKPEHIDFKRCWALSNLQLLPAKENIRKHNNLEKPFQPALAI